MARRCSPCHSHLDGSEASRVPRRVVPQPCPWHPHFSGLTCGADVLHPPCWAVTGPYAQVTQQHGSRDVSSAGIRPECAEGETQGGEPLG